mgnify:CR=1 FL=1
MRTRLNPALVMGLAIAAVWAGAWLIGYLAGYSGEPETFLRP